MIRTTSGTILAIAYLSLLFFYIYIVFPGSFDGIDRATVP